MRITAKPVRKNHFRINVYAGDGTRLLSTVTKVDDELPAFKSGDQWLVDIGEDTPNLTMVRVWVNPENGEIKVTPFGSMRRKSFALVRRWIVKLEL